MPTPGRIYYGSTLIFDDKNFLSFPQSVEQSAQITVTASASTNTKGSWTELIASTDADTTWLHVRTIISTFNSVDTSFLLDIGTGASGSETVRIANVGVGYSSSASPGFIFPLSIPSGTRIAARAQSAVASRAGTVSVDVLSDAVTAVLPTTLDTIGADTAASRGTNMPTSNTYVQLTASTSQDYQAIVATLGGSGTSFAIETSTYTIAKGASGSEVELYAFPVASTATETLRLFEPTFSSLYLGHVPSGTRLAVKQSVGRNYRDVILHGVPYA